jgi:hypothetical protein
MSLDLFIDGIELFTNRPEVMVYGYRVSPNHISVSVRLSYYRRLNIGAPDEIDDLFQQSLEAYEAKSNPIDPVRLQSINKFVYREGEHQLPTSSCIICLEDFHNLDSVINLNCRHIYHSLCIHRWFKDNNTCPMCKAIV